MASETTTRGLRAHGSAQRVFERSRDRARVQGGDVEALNLFVVTDSAFVKRTVALKEVSLAAHPLPETIEDGLGNCGGAVGDGVNGAPALAHDLISIRAIAKRQLRVRF